MGLESFVEIVQGLPDIICNQIKARAIAECHHKDLLSLLTSSSDSDMLYLATSCIASLFIAKDYMGVTMVGFNNYTEFKEHDETYKLLTDMIRSGVAHFPVLHLEVNDESILPAIRDYAKAFSKITIDDFTGHSLLDIYAEQEEINEKVLAKVVSIKTTLVNSGKLLSKLASTSLPMLAKVSFHINEIRDLSQLSKDSRTLEILQNISSHVRCLELSFPDLCNEYNDPHTIAILSKLHKSLPKMKLSSCSSVNIPNANTQLEYWNSVNPEDPRFLVLANPLAPELNGGLEYEDEYHFYLSQLVKFPNISLYGTESHDLTFIHKLLDLKPSYFQKLKSVCLILDHCSSQDLAWLPSSMDTLTLDVKKWQTGLTWKAPEYIGDLKIGVHDHRHMEILQECDWSGSQVGIFQMYIRNEPTISSLQPSDRTKSIFDDDPIQDRDILKDTIWELKVNSLPSGIQYVNIMSQFNHWAIVVDQMPSSWTKNTQVRYLPRGRPGTTENKDISIVADTSDWKVYAHLEDRGLPQFIGKQ